MVDFKPQQKAPQTIYYLPIKTWFVHLAVVGATGGGGGRGRSPMTPC